MEKLKLPAALTPEEWASGDLDLFGNWIRAERAGDRLRIVADIDETARLDAAARHGLAALCLDGQPFGFTHADVELLRAPWHHDDCGALYALYDHNCECEESHARVALRALAGRIAALLPPE